MRKMMTCRPARRAVMGYMPEQHGAETTTLRLVESSEESERIGLSALFMMRRYHVCIR
jgi:hypothetical protein